MDNESVEATIETVRAALSDALGEQRLEGIAVDASLVRTGILSSLEIVLVATALEERFELRIPPDQVTLQNFDTLRHMAMLVRSHGIRPFQQMELPLEGEWVAVRERAMAAIRRPILLAALTLVFLSLLDTGLRALMAGPLAARHHAFLEYGHRLYPVGGSYSQDDLAFSTGRHRIVQQERRGNPRVAVFGDSGTIGSFVPYQDAIPGALETALRRVRPTAEVFNLAFFMQFFPKDLMILEAVLERSHDEIPFDVAVFTLGDGYFNKDFIVHLQTAMPYLSLNADLLERFALRLPDTQRPSIDSLIWDLRQTSKSTRTVVGGWLERHAAIFHYAPYFRFLVTEILRSGQPFDYAYSIGRKPLMNPVPDHPPAKQPVSLGIAENSLDLRVISMARAAIEFLSKRGIDVVLYLKPHGPNEWRGYYEQGKKISAREIADELCVAARCKVVDLRWAISGSQFTDSLAHYNADANRQIAKQLAAVIVPEAIQ